MKIAIALTENETINNKHFGDAHKYRVYQFSHENSTYLKDIVNPFFAEDDDHNNPEKGNHILSLFESEAVDIVISQQFGKNIKIIKTRITPATTRFIELPGLLEHIGTYYHEIRNKWLVDKTQTLQI